MYNNVAVVQYAGVGGVLLRLSQSSPDGDTHGSSVQSAVLVATECRYGQTAAKQSTWFVAYIIRYLSVNQSIE